MVVLSFTGAITLLLLYSLYSNIAAPTSFVLHRTLNPSLGTPLTLALQLLSLLSTALTAAFAVYHTRTLLYSSIAATAVMCAAWLCILLSHSLVQVNTVYTFLAPLILFGLTMLAYRNTLAIERGIQELERAKYRYKSL